jgi:hypothetical protein
MIPQNLPSPVRKPSNRKADEAAGISAGLSSNPTFVTETGPLSHLTVHRNPRFGRVIHPQSTGEIKHYWLTVVPSRRPLNGFPANEAKRVISTPTYKGEEHSSGTQTKDEGIKTKPSVSRTKVKVVPLDFLSCTCWNSSWANATDFVGQIQTEMLTKAAREKASAHLDQLRYWLLVLVFVGLCTTFSSVILNKLTGQERGSSPASTIATEIQNQPTRLSSTWGSN